MSLIFFVQSHEQRRLLYQDRRFTRRRRSCLPTPSSRCSRHISATDFYPLIPPALWPSSLRTPFPKPHPDTSLISINSISSRCPPPQEISIGRLQRYPGFELVIISFMPPPLCFLLSYSKEIHLVLRPLLA